MLFKNLKFRRTLKGIRTLAAAATRFVYNIYQRSYISDLSLTLSVLFIIFIGARLAAGHFIHNIYRRSFSSRSFCL